MNVSDLFGHCSTESSPTNSISTSAVTEEGSGKPITKIEASITPQSLSSSTPTNYCSPGSVSNTTFNPFDFNNTLMQSMTRLGDPVAWTSSLGLNSNPLPWSQSNSLYDPIGKFYCQLISTFERQLTQRIDQIVDRVNQLEQDRNATRAHLIQLDQMLKLKSSPDSDFKEDRVGSRQSTRSDSELCHVKTTVNNFGDIPIATTCSLPSSSPIGLPVLPKINHHPQAGNNFSCFENANIDPKLDEPTQTLPSSITKPLTNNNWFDCASAWNHWLTNLMTTAAKMNSNLVQPPMGSIRPLSQNDQVTCRPGSFDPVAFKYDTDGSSDCTVQNRGQRSSDQSTALSDKPLNHIGARPTFESTTSPDMTTQWSQPPASLHQTTLNRSSTRNPRLRGGRGRIRGKIRDLWPVICEQTRRHMKRPSLPTSMLKSPRWKTDSFYKSLFESHGGSNTITSMHHQPLSMGPNSAAFDSHLSSTGGTTSQANSSKSSPSTMKATNSVGHPIVIVNPKEPREIYIGGVQSVPLPLWAYKKCLTMVRGEAHELGPRLCLRLLQSLFSLQYLVTHNYNGSGGKAPIDPTVMGAVLRQAQIQFGSGYFFTEPMALGKLRDYLNNAFRVMAFRQRKGERVRSPFWNERGEPVHGLDAPVEFAETSDVIVLTSSPSFCTDLPSLDQYLPKKVAQWGQGLA